MFSVCVVTYNSLEYLKILYASIKKNSKLKYEFVVHDNASVDGTKEWLEQNGIFYTRSEKNEGNPALNYAVKNAKYEHIFLPNPDTYILPGWDFSFLKQINKFKSQKIDKFMMSFCCIEPLGANPEYVINYCGHTPDTFDEKKLLDFCSTDLHKYVKQDTIQYSFPNCMPKKLWEECGGMDFEYWPGWTCDVDLAARIYKVGCRNFILLAQPKAYHFINGTYKKMTKEDNAKNGWDIFQRKWGMSVEQFRNRMCIAQPFRTICDGVLDV